MKKWLTYIILLLIAAVACEEIYNPELDEVDDLLVVEAILISNQTTNYINLSQTKGFNSTLNSYSPVTGANVYLVNENNEKIPCDENEPGKYYLNIQIESEEKYYLWIDVESETYKSDWQEVPEVPVIDSIYPEFYTRTIIPGVANSTDNIVSEKGIQIYADMDNDTKLNHYRFTSRKVLQFVNYYDTVIFMPIEMPIYCWKTYYPTGSFNIAGPPEYSTEKSITKHPVEFFVKNYNKLIPDSVSFAGWIYFLYQYGLNEDTYNYYSDLNSQLDAEGKIFDPVYIQAKGNISCTSSPEQAVLGNFEISSYAEKRYFLFYYKTHDNLKSFKSIPYLYDVPEDGTIKDIKPDFWEEPSRFYPNE